MADDLASWARRRAPELLARAEAEAVAALRDALSTPRSRGGECDPTPPGARRGAAAARRGEAPAGDGLWAYCVSQAGEPVADGARRDRRRRVVEQVEARGLAALVSRVPLAEFGAGPLRTT